MARASTRTILSLDKYADIMGIDPAFFSGGCDIELPDGRVLFPLSNSQNDVWPQYSWQNFDQVSREELARQIKIAEGQIIHYLGFNPVPGWTESERKSLPLYHRPEMQFAHTMYDTSYNERQVITDLAYFISGGRRATTLIDSVSVVYSDGDADGWSELATISVTVPSGTDPLEVKVYFDGHESDQTYEIRKPKTKTMSGNIITFVFNTWQMVDPDLFEGLSYNDNTSKWIDFSDTDNFVDTVNVYREYNDTTQNHCTLYYQSAVDGSITSSGGFLYKLQDDNFVIPVKASYDTTEGKWVREYTQCGYSDYVDLWYYSGMRNRNGLSLDFDSYLPQDIAVSIAYLATARLERGFYANNNATALAARLREDMLVASREEFKSPTFDARTNPFGSRVGEIMAWRNISRYYTARRSGGSL